MSLRVPIKTIWLLLTAILLVGCIPNTIPALTPLGVVSQTGINKNQAAASQAAKKTAQTSLPVTSTSSSLKILQEATFTELPYVGPLDTVTPLPYVEPVETLATSTFEPYPGAQTPTLNPSIGPTSGGPTPTATPTARVGTPASQTPVGHASSTPLTGTPIPGLSETPNPETTALPTATSTPFQQTISTSRPPQNLFQTVTIWHSWSPAETQTLEDVIQSFQNIYPNIKFVLTYVPLDELQGNYERAAYLGNGPSLLLGPADWGPAFFDKELVADLGSTADAQFLATINQAALNEARYKGALIGLPYAIRSGIVMYRNKTILSKAPASFDELVTLSKAATHGGTVGAYLEWSFFYSAAHLDGLGGQLMDQNGDPGFNTSLGVDWLSLLYAFRQAGPTEFNGNRDLDTFKQGKAGIIFDGTWNEAQLAQAVGAQNLAIDPWPAYKNGHLSGYLQTDNIYLNANFSGDQRYAALQFMGFFLAREVQAIMTRAGHIPAVMDVKVDDPLMQQEMEAFKGGVAYPIRPEINAYWDPLQAAMLSVVNNNADPVSALQQAYESTKTGIAKIREGQ